MPILSTDVLDQVAEDLNDCRGQLRVGSRSFHAAAHLLPGSFCRPASALYAFCRIADDAVAGDPDPGRALQGLHARLDALYAGRPVACAADRALAKVVREHAIPKDLLEALLEGFAWDSRGRRYQNLGELQDYAARVAGTELQVPDRGGVEHVQEAQDLLPGLALARACDLGVAMQLTNIARDVGEDARAGRLYLPIDWLHEAGIDPQDFVANPVFSAALGGVVKRLLDEAEILYRRADSGIAVLPRRCAPAMYAARLLYAEIGCEVARRHYDSVSQRAVVSPWRKLRVLARLPALSLLPRSALGRPALAATEYLVHAAAFSAATQDARSARTGFWGRAAWFVDVFEELDRRERGFPPRSLVDDAGTLAPEGSTP